MKSNRKISLPQGAYRFMLIVFLFLLLENGAFGQLNISVLPSPINSDTFNSINPTLNQNQTRLCFIRTKSYFDPYCIMVSDFVNGQWTSPYVAYKAKSVINGVSINATGDKIYFSEPLKVGKKMDDGVIRVIQNYNNNTWSSPISLKIEQINTREFEILPFINIDDSKLYFKRLGINSKVLNKYFVADIKEFNNIKIKEIQPPILNGIRQILGHVVPINDNDFIFNNGENFFGEIVNDTMRLNSKINVTGINIDWISSDKSIAYGNSNTEPKKILKILLSEDRSIKITQNKDTVTTIKNTEQPKFGKYYALLIGVSEYDDFNLKLERPAKDVVTLKRILNESYTFEDDKIITLLNPTRKDIIRELYKLRNIITEKDNLLIFYAGHGYWDDKIKQGYWWPRDASKNDPSNWLSNSDLKEQIRGISSKHTLLISDACFSGGIFKTRGVEDLKKAEIEIQFLYRMKSRRAITSGTLSTVPDQSVFFDFFTKRLTENESQFITSQTIYNSLRLAVINNSFAVPQDGVILETGDEGGDFVFIKRSK